MGTRPTVKQVSDDLNAHKASVERKFADAADVLAGLRKVTSDHRQGLQRGSVERKLLDRRIDGSEKKLDDLHRDLLRLRKRMQTLESTDQVPDRIAHATKAELERLGGRLDTVWGDLNDQLSSISSRVDMVNDNVELAHGRIDKLDAHPNNEYDYSQTTVDTTIEQQSSKYALIVAAVIGLITVWVAYHMTDWNGFDRWQDAKWPFAIIVGIAVGLIAWDLLEKVSYKVSSTLNFVRMPESDKQEVESKEVSPEESADDKTAVHQAVEDEQKATA